MGKKFYGFMRGMLYAPVKIVFPAKIIGKENMPKDNGLITVTNHLSWIDIPMLAIHVPGFRHFIAKKEIGKKKFIKNLALALGVILIDRDKADLSAIRESIQVLKNNEGLSIFPEGTRNKTDEALHEIKNGVTMLAIKGNAPIVPILIHTKAKAFKKNFMYIAPPFSLDEFKGKRLDSETLNLAAAVVEKNMREAKVFLDDYVLNKRWIEIKKQKKLQKKEARAALKVKKSERE